jgi:hypothetical protein
MLIFLPKFAPANELKEVENLKTWLKYQKTFYSSLLPLMDSRRGLAHVARSLKILVGTDIVSD